MSDWKGWMLRKADDAAVASQIVMRSIGVLADGHDRVEEVVESGARIVRFPDLEAIGWPAFELALPAEAEFDQAVSSLLTRGGMWSCDEAVADVARRIELRGEGMGLKKSVTAERTALRAESLDLRVGIGRRDGRTLISVTQRRKQADLEEGVRSRGARYARWRKADL